MNNTWWDKVSINNIEYIEDPNDKSFTIFWIDWDEIINHKNSKVVDSLDYKRDRSLKRKFYLILRDINFVKKYRKYNW